MKITAIILSFLMLFSGTVFAEPIAEPKPYDDGETVGFKLEGFTPSAAISVHITDENGAVEFEDEMYSNENGGLEFSYLCKGESGNYTAVFAEPEGTNKDDCSYIFVSKGLATQMKTDFTASNVDYYDFYNTYLPYLMIDLTVYNTLADKEAALALAGANLEGEVTVAAIEKAFYAAVFCGKINETKSASELEKLLTDKNLDKALGFTLDMPKQDDKGVLYEASNDVKQSVLTKAAAQNLTTVKVFKDDLYLDIFKTVIEKAAYYTEVRNILKAYNDKGLLTADVTKYDNRTDSTLPFKAMMRQTYQSYTAAADAFNGYVYPVSQDGNNGNGGGGGGGGGVTTIEVVTTEPTAEVKETYTPDIAEVSWAADALKAMYDRGIMKGDDKGYMRPANNITRAETAVIICKMAGEPLITGGINFLDVQAEDWFYPYVCTAYSAGLFSGKSKECFDPDAYITREEMAVVLQKMKKFTNTTDFVFADDSEISSWAKSSIYSLYAAGVISGKTETEFVPRVNITRAETAVMLHRAGGAK